jgi:hypothetical protein
MTANWLWDHVCVPASMVTYRGDRTESSLSLAGAPDGNKKPSWPVIGGGRGSKGV